MLLEENQTLAEDYRLLLRDHTVLESEMGRVKQAVNYSTSSRFGCPPGMERIEGGSDVSLNLKSLAIPIPFRRVLYKFHARFILLNSV